MAVSNSRNNSISAYRLPVGSFLEEFDFGLNRLNYPTKICFHPQGHLLIADSSNGRVQVCFRPSKLLLNATGFVTIVGLSLNATDEDIAPAVDKSLL